MRLYLAGLTLLLAVACACAENVSAQMYVVTACPLLYMVLEMREEIQGLDALEARLSAG